MPCPECGSTNVKAAMVWGSSWWPVIEEDGRWILNPLDFDDPLYREVEIRCESCHHFEQLTNNAWEFM